jgi:hypothetical protein
VSQQNFYYDNDHGYPQHTQQKLAWIRIFTISIRATTNPKINLELRMKKFIETQEKSNSNMNSRIDMLIY